MYNLFLPAGRQVCRENQKMPILQYNEIKNGKIILFEGAPHQVLSAHVFRMQQRKPVNATKLKNLLTGGVSEYSFHQSEKVEEVELETKEIKYLYYRKPGLPAGRQGEYWFADSKDSSARFSLKENIIGEKAKFLKPNTTVEQILFQGKIISIRLPIKVELKVTEAPPGIKGDTAQGGQKQITLETGATLNVPLFVKEGDTIRINTESGQYVDRV